MSDVLIVPTGTANLASVKAAFNRLGAAVEMVENADQIETARRVVMPGVGAFAASISHIREQGFADPLAARIKAGRATFAVCVGFQILFEESEESPGIQGLGVIPGRITRLPETVRCPQLGWNRVEAGPGCGLIESGHGYFANSYKATPPLPDDRPNDWAVATAVHGEPFIAALERGSLLACQFHPELSSAWGQALIARWLERTA